MLKAPSWCELPTSERQWQTQCPDQEDRHLVPGHRAVRTVHTRPASRRDAFCDQLLDPRRGPVALGDVGELGAAGRRGLEAPAVLGSEQEDRHLGPGYWAIRAIVVVPTSRRDPLGHQLLDPGRRPVAWRHVAELVPR